MKLPFSVTAALILAVGLVSSQGCENSADLFNVSYDPTREFYQEFNKSFAQDWKRSTGQTVEIRNSHGGSGSQARSVIEGQQADVVTLALAYDIDAIANKGGLIAANWQSRLPRNSSPYVSTIVFLVRKGNPKGIRDWDDLLKPDVKIITPNPKTSGGARWNYLAAWGYALKRELGSLDKLKDPAAKDAVAKAQEKAREFVGRLFSADKIPVLDTGARGSTNTFVQRQMGDVLLAWENEALLQTKQLGQGKFEIVVPSVSILAEPPVAVVDKVVDKRGTRKLAEAYLKHLYTPAGQQVAAEHYYRPTLPETAEKYRDQFPTVELFTIDAVFGGWQKAQKEHFADGGTFDVVYKK
jgi:sulfate transport system substrate-binding protein